MPFLLLIFGLLIGGYALYSFLRKASKDQAQKVLLSLAIAFVLLMIFVMILIGKLPIAGVLAAVLIPLVAKLYQIFSKTKDVE